MPNAYATNYTLFSAGETFNAIWKLTRTMLAAGWRYKASGNGQSTGTPAWNAGNTGTTPNITTVSGNVATVTGLQGMSPGNEGQYITLGGFTAGGAPNNGTWLIVNYVSSSSVQIYNAAAVASTSGTTWSLIRDAALDLWAQDGYVNLTAVGGGGTGSGAGVNIAAPAAGTGQVTITGVTAFSQNLSPGRVVTITGSTLGNNGNYRISDVTTAGTSIDVYAPGLVAETGNAALTLTEQYGGVVGAGGGILTFVAVTSSGQNTLIDVKGLSGLSASDVGRRIKFLNPANASNIGSFAIVQVISSSECYIYSPFATINDFGSGGTSGTPTLQWIEWDPLQQTYPSTAAGSYLQGANGQGAWLVLQGPSTMRIPIGTALPVGTFIRGEQVQQANTGAQGELLGIVTDSSGGTGYLVVAPRVIGTGANASSATETNMQYGWSTTTDTITGAVSGATVTPSAAATPINYVREQVWWKNNATTGHEFHQTIDQNPTGTEAQTTSTTGRFSIMAGTLSQIGAQVAPASSNTTSPVTNGFPATNQGAGSYVGTYVPCGTAGTGNPATSAPQWTGGATPTSAGKAQLLVANNIEGYYTPPGLSAATGVSSDGTWQYYQSCSSSGYQGYSYLRLDNQEDGDVDPYVHMGMFNGASNGSPTRASMSGGSGSPTDNMNTSNTWFGNVSFHGWAGFRRRGLTTGEFYSWFDGALLFSPGWNGYISNLNSGNPDQVATAPATTFVREPVWLFLTGNTNQNGGARMRKGTPRWLFMCQGGSVNSTFDSKQWLILSSTAIMFVAGPYDGVTTPSF